jgi:hypothetical protein
MCRVKQLGWSKSSTRDRFNVVVALTALMAFFLGISALYTFADPDMWHEMALIREALALGRLPLDDCFAYTPTVHPVVHHEWGTGAILYFVVTHGGATGLLTLRYVLMAGVAAVCVVCARRRGASYPVLIWLAPIAIFLSWGRFTTLRAQVFTYLLLVVELYFLDRDRDGERWWIGPWLVLFLLWVNLHAGFASGFVLYLCYILERLIYRRAMRHLLLVGLAMVLLIALNPYGLNYYLYLWRALLMDRAPIPEWNPLWEVWPPIQMCYAMSLLVVGYAVLRLGIRRLPGLLLVLVTAYAAVRHQRHLPLYAVTWLCYVPAYVEGTKLGEMLRHAWSRRPRVTASMCCGLALAWSIALIAQRPWQLRMPANPGEHGLFLYPVGAVEYLRTVGFRGNLMVPFRAGAFITWKLHPAVKVSIDGRYEVAYPHGAMAENLGFYNAEPGWNDALSRYPTDAVLVPTDSAVSARMSDADGWSRVYVDNAYEIYAPAHTSLPHIDRRGRVLVGVFP